ncbi:hypothetical protein GCM10012280_15290 [Wenjunlia tyrosinilytica]|uniref:OmpR/PhoB-type domain-containing protein n=1 Tax=Wenjunlia tyrosinilytica TaxID=1544741 RepID=A0A917ZLB2_9ACTN|nr:hypothetical protein GCM10012280_15290 [Wenjunlia tyrosinilytica]
MPVRYLRVHSKHTVIPDDASRPAAKRQPIPDPPAKGVHVDGEQRIAWVAGRRLTLTFLEFELLAYLVAHPRRVHTRAQLMAAVWGQPPVGDIRTVDVHVARLRRKLGPDHRATIATVRQVGYTFDPRLAKS